ncbi:RICIN domain-containing protein [Streptomyces mirabilis]|uniref:RICIN domain-containing protein n=1 Tax=Streptomyces mirabilis TaxID=68239 RepID=UPI0033A94E8C
MDEEEVEVEDEPSCPAADADDFGPPPEPPACPAVLWSGVGTVRAMGKCMDVAWGSTADGATIQLANCSGNPAQQFRLNPAHDLVNPQADKCVDVRDKGTANGTRLQLWSCNGQDNQKWTSR